MYSLKSRAWQLGMTGVLLLLTFVASLSTVVFEFEYDLFGYILNLQPSSRALATSDEIDVAPQWLIVTVYALIFLVYVRKFTRSRTTALSFLTINILLFVLFMLEILLAIFSSIFLPVVLPGMVMILVSSVYWIIDTYQRAAALFILQRDTVSLADIQQQIDTGDLKNALVMLKLCPYSDDLLEIGYELGMLLESRNHWASALNLYHWLSHYDPGLGDFVTRIEEIRENRLQVAEVDETETSIRKIGHYQLLKKIAKGATAVVYEAYDLNTHNRVALKVMVSQSDQQVERDRIDSWLKEAEILSQFEHRNIVRIHDAAIDNGKAYIAMDYIPGYPMSLRLRKREYITVGEFIRISRSVLNALVVAHHHGVVHGDIKPANIIYDENRDIYILTDFGAAYARQKGGRSENVIIGTPSYMSPEQLQGKKLDGRSDLFSLAVSLYHLLTGQQPFTGDSLYQLKQSIILDQPTLGDSALPVGLKEVILKALQKKPYMRFVDAKQMLEAVEYCESELQQRLRQKQG